MTVNITSIPRGDENGLDKINANFEKVKTIDDGVTALNQKDTTNFKIGDYLSGRSIDLNNLTQGVHIIDLQGVATGSSWPKSQQNSNANEWGTLLQVGDSNLCTQTLILVGVGMYYRIKTSNSWSAWYKVQVAQD